MNSVAVLLDASRGAIGSTPAPVVLADAGVETENAAVDALIEGVFFGSYWHSPS